MPGRPLNRAILSTGRPGASDDPIQFMDRAGLLSQRAGLALAAGEASRAWAKSFTCARHVSLFQAALSEHHAWARAYWGPAAENRRKHREKPS
jgi:hypothetical protein